MIRINLIPEPVPATNSRIVLTELAVLAAAIAIGYYAPNFYASSIQDDASAIAQETQQKRDSIANLKRQGDEINQFKATISDLKSRSDRIRNLTEGRKQPVYLLDKLQQQHPDSLWLKSIKLDSGQLQINGYTTDTELISDYAARIKSINENAQASTIDLENFVPPFAKYLKHGPEDAEQTTVETKATLPLNLSNLMIKKFSLSTVGITPAYEFELLVQVTMPGGI
jgi:hypothetical protein